jgi:hypothetical protein
VLRPIAEQATAKEKEKKEKKEVGSDGKADRYRFGGIWNEEFVVEGRDPD